MADKVLVKLNMSERFMLLGIIPREGDFTTLKIVRKLRETLAPDEKENKEYAFQYEYACRKTDMVDDNPVLCKFIEVSSVQPKCPFHREYMRPTGRLFWKPEMSQVEKEIWFGNKANSLITEALKRLSNEEKLTEQHLPLYEKFIKSEQEDEDT